MIAVETVILKLVGDYEFVIIPGFGALLSHQVPAIYDQTTEFFSPPVKKLAFNEYLKLDDGLVANYISRHEQTSHAEAVEYVKQYTDNLRSDLELNRRAKIAGIGAFSKNIEGKLVFEPDTEKYFKDEWYGFERIRVKRLDHKLTSPLTSNAASEHIDANEVFEFEEETLSGFRWSNWATAALIAGLLCCLSLFLVNTRNEYIKSTLNPFTELFDTDSGKDEGQGTLPVSSSELIKADEAKPASAIISDPVAVTPDSAASSTNMKPVTDPVNVVSKEVKPVKSEAKLYVIAGTFKGMRQAKVLLHELKGKGFDDAIILPGDRYNKKVKVAIDGFETQSQAYRASARLKAVIGEEGWVYKRR